MITFESIRWKNLLQTGNYWIEVNLSESPSMLFIGDNGAGKSTIIDALSLGLFGKPFRDENKPNMVNDINDKNCVIEITLTKNKDAYLVRRGLKPNIFEIYCNDVLIDQSSKTKNYQAEFEQKVLGFGYKAFTQIIVLGSVDYIPFMKLPAATRREFIEDLLELNVFSSMNKLLKEQVSDTNKTVEKVKDKLDTLETYIELKEKELKEETQGIQQQMDDVKDEISQVNAKIDQKYFELGAISTTKILNAISGSGRQFQPLDIETKRNLTKAVTTLQSEVSNLEYKMALVEESTHFYEHNDSCPTCKQTIVEKFADNILDDLENQRKEIQNKINRKKKYIKEGTEHLEAQESIEKEIQEQDARIAECSKELDSLKAEKERLGKEYDRLLTSTYKKKDDSLLTKFLEEKVELTEKYENLKFKAQTQAHAGKLLKDSGIKAAIIKQYIPVVNRLVNGFLDKMGMFLKFELDETFNAVFKSRHVKERHYGGFSNGQKMRINLALLFTWRQVAKMMNNVNCNLMILDEIFDSSLDNAGMADTADILLELSKGMNIIVMSHKPEVFNDKFDKVMKFTTEQNFTRMSEVEE